MNAGQHVPGSGGGMTSFRRSAAWAMTFFTSGATLSLRKMPTRSSPFEAFTRATFKCSVLHCDTSFTGQPLFHYFIT